MSSQREDFTKFFAEMERSIRTMPEEMYDDHTPAVEDTTPRSPRPDAAQGRRTATSVSSADAFEAVMHQMGF